MGVKVISEKLSYNATKDFLNVVILGKIERWKETLLITWCLAWVFCGGIVINEYIVATDREMRMGLLVFLMFWAYFLFTIGRITLYRKGGNELVRIEGDKLILKRSYFTFGKSKTYFIENIDKVVNLELAEKSIAFAFENTWWVLGGYKLAFDYNGKQVKFGMQINNSERDFLRNLLNKRVKANLKTI